MYSDGLPVVHDGAGLALPDGAGLVICEVMACLEPATHVLSFPEGSKLYQGQKPSPRCYGHSVQALEVLGAAHAAFRLAAITATALEEPPPSRRTAREWWRETRAEWAASLRYFWSNLGGYHG